MTSTFSGMEIALRGLTAARLSMGVVSHNVANAEVPGYSRQRVDLRAAAPWAYPGLGIGANPAQVGQGVEVRSISRVRDLLLDRQYRTEVGYRSAYDVRRTFLEKLETALADTEGSGLSLVLDRFFHAWQDLSLDAENLSVRQEVLGYAEQLVDLFHHVGDSFTALSQDARDLLRFRVEEVNALVREIADLNREIARITPHGYTPNDLYDERDRLLDRLAQLVDVEVEWADDGTVRVRFAGGIPLVEGGNSGILTVDGDKVYVTDARGVPFADAAGNSLPLRVGSSFAPGVLARGEIAEALHLLEDVLPAYAARYESLLRGLAEAVNAAHRSGFDLEGNPGEDFFVFAPPGSSGDLHAVFVNPRIADHPERIAAAREAGGAGDGRNARAIAELAERPIPFEAPDGTVAEMRVKDAYAAIFGELATDVQRSQLLAETKASIVRFIDERRQSASGVSLDEEMARLLSFQHMYTAAARALTAMDEAIDTVIHRLGLVGR